MNKQKVEWNANESMTYKSVWNEKRKEKRTCQDIRNVLVLGSYFIKTNYEFKWLWFKWF